MITLEKKLKNKYNGNYKKVFDKEFQETVKRADQSRQIFLKTNASSCLLSFLNINGEK
mgnify:CR=1 FL=1